METLFKTQLTRQQILDLRDVFIFKTSKLTTAEFNVIALKLTRELHYTQRNLYKSFTRRKKIFDKHVLEKKVWKDFIDEERNKGKNTLMIANEIGVSLATVNSYF